MKKIIAGVLLATCLALGREATFSDMLDAIIYLGNGYLEVKNNQGRTIKLPLQLYGYKVMFEGLIDRDKSKQCISYKSLPQAQKARMALWRWSDTIEGHSTYPYQDDKQKQIEREAILLNDIATGTEQYKECQKVVIAKAGEMIDKLFSLFSSDNQSPQATTTYDVGYWANEIKKARHRARDAREYKEYVATVKQAEKWIQKFGERLEQLDGHFVEYDDKLYKPQFQKWQATFIKKWEAYEDSKEYKAWKVLEKQALDSVNSALASTGEYQRAERAKNESHSTREYQAMIKAQNAVRATQHFKNIKQIAKLKDIDIREGTTCYSYASCRRSIRESKEFKAWQIANERFEATNEFKAWQVASKASQTTNQHKARELVKKEIREGRHYMGEYEGVGVSNYVFFVRKFGIQDSPCRSLGNVYDFFKCSDSGDREEEPIFIPKNWEYDLWYGREFFSGFHSYKNKENLDWEDDEEFYYDWEY